MYSVELYDGDWMLDQKHDESLGAKDMSSWRQLNSDINACRRVAEGRYCDFPMAHIFCVYLPVQFIIHHRRIIFHNHAATIFVCFDTGIANNYYRLPDVWVLKVDGGEERVNGTLY